MTIEIDYIFYLMSLFHTLVQETDISIVICLSLKYLALK